MFGKTSFKVLLRNVCLVSSLFMNNIRFTQNDLKHSRNGTNKLNSLQPTLLETIGPMLLTTNYSNNFFPVICHCLLPSHERWEWLLRSKVIAHRTMRLFWSHFSVHQKRVWLAWRYFIFEARFRLRCVINSDCNVVRDVLL